MSYKYKDRLLNKNNLNGLLQTASTHDKNPRYVGMDHNSTPLVYAGSGPGYRRVMDYKINYPFVMYNDYILVNKVRTFEEYPISNVATTAQLRIDNPDKVPDIGYGQVYAKSEDPLKLFYLGADGIECEYATTIEKSMVGIIPCQHKWQKYEGLTELYEFCTLCDKKRDIT